MSASNKKPFLLVIIILAAIAIGVYYWKQAESNNQLEGFISSNGRIEATELDISSKLAGRIQEILVNEGDFIKAGQPLAHMQIDVLKAQLEQTRAEHQQALNNVNIAKVQVNARESELIASQAVMAQRDSEFTLAKQRLSRTETLAARGATPKQTLDDDRAAARSTEAGLNAAKAQVNAAQAAIKAAKAQVIGAESAVIAAEAAIKRIQADIDDSILKSPRDGRVQFRIAQPGEVVGGGGKILNVIDLNDVYMTFFLPETVAGRIALDSDVHIVLDAAPEYVIPAKVSFVASTAQFTPKTVETASERQKLMFRVKARISPELLQKHLEQVKTGLPGMAWIKLDPNKTWPEHLTIKLPE